MTGLSEDITAFITALAIMEAVNTSETSVNIYGLHGAFQKAVIFILAAVRRVKTHSTITLPYVRKYTPNCSLLRPTLIRSI
jgi:hypothetical protein